ncbi:MAG: VanZ family protein [Candidatus Pacearchaeota archaeon]
MLKRAIIWFEKYNKLSWIIVLLTAIFIFYISSLTFSLNFQKTFSLKSYIYHFVIFFIFSLFFLISAIKGKKISNFIWFLIIIILILYAVLDEFHQYFVPGRSCSLRDVITDSLGIFFALISYKLKLL